MVVHLTAAPHEEALGDVLAAVAAAAGQIQFFKHMDVLALHLAVADKIKSRRQAGKAGADDISRFFVHILGLFGMGKGFISASGIIHNKYLLLFSVYAFIIPAAIGFTMNRKSPVIKVLSRSRKV